MADKGTVTASLTLVSTDRALMRLVSLECREMALSMQSTDQLPQYTTEDSALLLDLDSPGVIDALMQNETAATAGICRDVTALPAELKAKLSHLLPRPFHTRQLRALIGQLCGRADAFVAEAVAYAPRAFANIGDLSIRMASETELLLGDRSIRLTPTEGAMMRLLIEHRGDAVSKEQLQSCLSASDAGETNKLEVYVCFLRRKIERPTGLHLITTVRGKGYRLE